MNLMISRVNLKYYPKSIKKIIKGNYNIGWLCECKNGAIYNICGISQNKQDAIEAANNLLIKNVYNQKEIFIYDNSISKIINYDELKNIREASSRIARRAFGEIQSSFF